MASMYDSGLFNELGDLLGHDPTFYEEPDVSSLPGDIIKHSYSTSIPSTNIHSGTKVPELLPSAYAQADGGEIDSLISEGSMLLDQLMADNGLDLLTAPVELADVDELISSEAAHFGSTPYDTNDQVHQLFAYFYEPTADVCQSSPDSPVSTLPSEPSSPVDLFSLESFDTPAAEPIPSSLHNSHSTADELDALLSSLLDDGHTLNGSQYGDDQFINSPTSSSESDQSSCYGYLGSDSEEVTSSNSSGSPAKMKVTKKRKSSIPYSKLPTVRKEKKKLQNKEAAIRYRQKKKNETQVLADEEAVLQEQNDSLKSEVLNLEREIMCMKELLSDVFNIHSI